MKTRRRNPYNRRKLPLANYLQRLAWSAWDEADKRRDESGVMTEEGIKFMLVGDELSTRAYDLAHNGEEVRGIK